MQQTEEKNEDEKNQGPLLKFRKPRFTFLSPHGISHDNKCVKRTQSEFLKEKESKMYGPNRPPTPHPKCGSFRRYNSSQI